MSLLQIQIKIFLRNAIKFPQISLRKAPKILYSVNMIPPIFSYKSRTVIHPFMVKPIHIKRAVYFSKLLVKIIDFGCMYLVIIGIQYFCIWNYLRVHPTIPF